MRATRLDGVVTVREAEQAADSEAPFLFQAKFIYKSGKPRRVDTYFENLIGFAQKYGSPGQIPPLQQLLSAEEGGMEYTFLPRPVRSVISYVAIPLAKLVGYQPYYAEYTSPA